MVLELLILRVLNLLKQETEKPVKEKRKVKHSGRTVKNTKVECFIPPAVNEVVTYNSICGRSMDTKLDYVALPGGLVNGVVTYMVSDDLCL